MLEVMWPWINMGAKLETLRWNPSFDSSRMVLSHCIEISGITSVEVKRVHWPLGSQWLITHHYSYLFQTVKKKKRKKSGNAIVTLHRWLSTFRQFTSVYNSEVWTMIFSFYLFVTFFCLKSIEKHISWFKMVSGAVIYLIKSFINDGVHWLKVAHIGKI